VITAPAVVSWVWLRMCSGVVREQRMAERENVMINVEIFNDILAKVRVEHKSVASRDSS
jgi:hypothetical protein